MNNSEIKENSEENLSDMEPSSHPYQSEFHGDNFNSQYSDDSNESENYVTGAGKMMQIGLFWRN